MAKPPLERWVRRLYQQRKKIDMQALNGISATLRHDEGAIAQCTCGWYTLNTAALSDRRPPCWNCDSRDGWSGSFKPPTPDAKWSGLVKPLETPNV